MQLEKTDNNDLYGLKQLHAYYLAVMDDFHKYCMDKNIQYSLSGGTLLGAIRHEGFIPWDDDVDVMLDRENYERLLKEFQKDPMKGYKIIGNTWVKRISRKDNPYIDAEEQCVDLFVFDPIPGNKIEAKLKVLMLRTLQGMMKDKPEYNRFSLFHKCLLLITWSMGRPFPNRKKQEWYTNLSRIGKRYNKINIYNTWFKQIGSLQFDKHIIDGYVPVKFEGREYMAIRGYDSYLTELYGDYMQLPPEEQRKPMHNKVGGNING